MYKTGESHCVHKERKRILQDKDLNTKCISLLVKMRIMGIVYRLTYLYLL